MQNRTHQILFRLNEKEYLKLEKNVKKTGLKREAYIRSVLSNAVPREAPPADYYELICEVRRTGANINQLLKVANSIGILDVPKIRTALEDNRKTEQMLWNTFAPEKV